MPTDHEAAAAYHFSSRQNRRQEARTGQSITSVFGSIEATVQHNLLLEDELTQEVTEETAQQTLTIETTSFSKICNIPVCRTATCQRLLIAIGTRSVEKALKTHCLSTGLPSYGTLHHGS